METDIYKSKKLKGTYLFIRSGSDTDNLSDEVVKKFGNFEYFKSLTLISGAPLIAADPDEVISNIEKHGFHMQGAEISVKVKESDVSEVGAAVGGGILAASLGLGPVGAIAGAVIGAWIANHSKDEENK